MPSSSSDKTIPYTPAKLSTQMGILFGFVAFLILIVGSYTTIWWLLNKREAKREADRKQDLINRGFGPLGYRDEKKSMPANGVGREIWGLWGVLKRVKTVRDNLYDIPRSWEWKRQQVNIPWQYYIHIVYINMVVMTSGCSLSLTVWSSRVSLTTSHSRKNVITIAIRDPLVHQIHNIYRDAMRMNTPQQNRKVNTAHLSWLFCSADERKGMRWPLKFSEGPLSLVPPRWA